MTLLIGSSRNTTRCFGISASIRICPVETWDKQPNVNRSLELGSPELHFFISSKILTALLMQYALAAYWTQRTACANDSRDSNCSIHLNDSISMAHTR